MRSIIDTIQSQLACVGLCGLVGESKAGRRCPASPPECHHASRNNFFSAPGVLMPIRRILTEVLVITPSPVTDTPNGILLSIRSIRREGGAKSLETH